MRPSSSAFKQDGADGDTSVSLETETDPDLVIQGYSDAYVAVVPVRVILDQCLKVERDPLPGNPGHCNIVGHKTLGKLRAIARASLWLEGYGPPGS